MIARTLNNKPFFIIFLVAKETTKNCPMCTFECEKDFTICTICKYSFVENQVSDQQEYVCPICTYDNKFYKPKCSICGHIFEKHQEEIGKNSVIKLKLKIEINFVKIIQIHQLRKLMI